LLPPFVYSSQAVLTLLSDQIRIRIAAWISFGTAFPDPINRYSVSGWPGDSTENTTENMSESNQSAAAHTISSLPAEKEKTQSQKFTGWRKFLPYRKTADESTSSLNSVDEDKQEATIEKWSLGILNDKKTEEVPGELVFGFGLF
jgi:hypothetical protein